ncbi:MAG: hypothetical protein IPL53_15825 [Ignavibacteria bacterium]|nr:hypothetical protein [Ignavibacteria bacterium]
MLGLWTLIFLSVVALFAQWIAPFDPNQQILEYSAKPIGFEGEALVKIPNEKNPDENNFIPIKGFVKKKTGKYSIWTLMIKKSVWMLLNWKRQVTDGLRN